MADFFVFVLFFIFVVPILFLCEFFKSNFSNFTGPESQVGLIIMEVIGTIILIYVLFSLLYYMFRPSTSTTAGNLGSSMGSILVNQMQIIQLILRKIIWIPTLPRAIIDLLLFLGSLISINLSSLFQFPECVADMQPLEKWGFAMTMPWCVFVLFLVWYGMARCHLDEENEIETDVIQTILQSAIYILWTCMYTTVVRTCFLILDCTQGGFDEDTLAEIKPTLIMDSRVQCSDVFGLQIASMVVFFFWAVLPFLILAFQLGRYKKKGTLHEKIEKSPLFRVLFGWAVTKYRKDSPFAYLWELINAATKVAMVAGAELMYAENRLYVHVSVTAVSLVLHIVVRPYKDTIANVVGVLFCIVELLGILSFENAIMQIVFVIILFVSLLVVVVIAATSSYNTFQASKKKHSGLVEEFQYFTDLEKKLLFPVLFTIQMIKKVLQKCSSTEAIENLASDEALKEETLRHTPLEDKKNDSGSGVDDVDSDKGTWTQQ